MNPFETEADIDRQLANQRVIDQCIKGKRCPSPYYCSDHGQCRRAVARKEAEPSGD